MKSWKCEVIADSSGTWAGNGLRFPTRIEAESYATDLGFRWTAVRHVRVSECEEPANYTFFDYKLKALEPCA